MIDGFGRNINYLRVSVTRRCNLNCSYCGAQNHSAEHELSTDEIEKIVRAFARCGITKVRLTGGEPLVRKDICEIAERIASVEGIKKLALTTNGINLKQYALPLKKAGVSAVNISLDTTDKEQFRAITGYDGLEKVFEGIKECQRVSLSPIRINAVIVRGQNETAAESLINIARQQKIDVRFIELMPFSVDGENEKSVVRGEDILRKFPYLKPVNSNKSDFEKSVARYYEGEGFKGRIGFITPISDKFCNECNRIRLLCDGKVKVCLGNDTVIDLMDVIDDTELLFERVRQAILSKPMEHNFSCGYGASHGLNRIGG